MRKKRTTTTRAELVTRTLREAILDGRISPGQRIPEEEYASMLGVSRMPIREAIRRLQSEGLVTVVPHVGAKVAMLSRNELEECYAIRLQLEPFAARVGVPRLSGRDLDRLGEICSEMEEATRRRDIVRLLQLAPDFHMTVYQASGMERLVQIIRSLWETTQPYRRSFLTDDIGTRSALEEHRRILKACRRRDSETVAQLIADGLRRTMDSLLARSLPAHSLSLVKADAGN